MICTKCNLDKEFFDFAKNSKNKNGLRSQCKPCDKEYRNKNKEKIETYRQQYYEQHREALLQYNKNYNELNSENIKKTRKSYRIKNSSKIKSASKEYYYKNKELLLNKNKKYREQNKESITEYKRQYKKNRRDSDSLYKLECNIRRLIQLSFSSKGSKKTNKTKEILGCSFEEFKIYISSKFESWMTWDNRGLYNGELNYGWDLDHIIPISSATNEEETIKLNHYTNFQPLCSYVNRNIKKDKI